MQVYLIPIGGDEYAPYFEAADQPDDADRAAETSLFGRLRRRMRDMLREAEAERHRFHETGVHGTDAGLMARLRRKAMRWIVERAAEQRLLWHLRTAPAATLEAPDDLTPDAALAILMRALKRDSDHHLRWFIANALGLIVSVALILVPGPNLLGYYFTFTTVGHLLAWRGAAHGLKAVTWQVSSSPIVSELRVALTLAAGEREQRVHAVAARLGLQHLASFFERLAFPIA